VVFKLDFVGFHRPLTVVHRGTTLHWWQVLVLDLEGDERDIERGKLPAVMVSEWWTKCRWRVVMQCSEVVVSGGIDGSSHRWQRLPL
jgi:hypothetical protein